jgi:hypothetical protein
MRQHNVHLFYVVWCGEVCRFLIIILIIIIILIVFLMDLSNVHFFLNMPERPTAELKMARDRSKHVVLNNKCNLLLLGQILV